ncbi:MAG: GAF domain-containing protein [Ignavibacteriae bacterium]|nr:GAF domain-containing protein [Ignavibacteriota bacterium]
METVVTIASTSKQGIYKEILPQIQSLVAGETDLIANLANTTSALKLAFRNISWVGFYFLKGNELVLGPFQGKPACVRIALGRGVCGTSAATKATLIVPNVHEFPGHIACDPDSKSEIVVPILKNNNVLGVFDVDSASFDTFDKIDKQYLEELCNWLSDNVF